MSILILIQTDRHSNSVFLKEFIEKSYFKEKVSDDKKFTEKDLSGSMVLYLNLRYNLHFIL